MVLRLRTFGLIAAVSALSIVAGGVVAQAQDAARPALDMRDFSADLAGEPTRVLVLAASHLSNFPNFAPEYADGLVGRLVAFEPDIIAVEKLSGLECEELRRFDDIHPGLAKRYCFDSAPAQAALGMDGRQAIVESQTLLKQVSATGSSPLRRRLAAVFLAAGEPASAVVQWLRLTAGDRLALDGLTEALVETLASLAVKNDETYLIGARLAAQQGLERVHAMDDHTADDILYGMDEAAGPAIQTIWSTMNPTLSEMREMPSPTDDESTLSIFRFNNLPSTQVGLARGEHGLAVSQNRPGLFGRQYTAWWETRNLRMAANIRATFSHQPGARVLVIVGGTHKPYLEAYLNQIHEVELVDAVAVLQ